MEILPEDCIASVLSRVSPRDACRSAAVATFIRNALESELLWDKFLPPDYKEIIAKSVFPVTYKSKKELFFKLSSPLLIDEGLKTFSIHKATGKKCYTLSARNLYIAWSANSLFWCWKTLPRSRFSEAVELRMTSWLEIEGKVNTKTLSPNTHYKAYLIVEVAHYRAFGLDVLPCEISIEVGVGGFHSRGKILFSHNKHSNQSYEHIFHPNEIKECSRSKSGHEIARGSRDQRKDGWLEIELGEFYNDATEKEVKMSLREVKGVHLKGGLVVDGIDIRPI
uniref:F-box protein PP2-B15-like n=1 Tax=Erigeron canadensis TaxID=72917 RepID=UPI001CB93605|nr:F-box protein PP2-B15-like [Erigeron canadensis]